MDGEVYRVRTSRASQCNRAVSVYRSPVMMSAPPCGQRRDGALPVRWPWHHCSSLAPSSGEITVAHQETMAQESEDTHWSFSQVFCLETPQDHPLSAFLLDKHDIMASPGHHAVLFPRAAAAWTQVLGSFFPGLCRVSPTTDAPVSGPSHSALMPWREVCFSYIFILLFLTFRTPLCLLPGRAWLRISCIFRISSIRLHSVRPTLWDPMDCGTPGLPVLHHLLEFAQTHVHQVSDAFQLSHSLLSPSPPAFNFSQHQSLFQWVSSSVRKSDVWTIGPQHPCFPSHMAAFVFWTYLIMYIYFWLRWAPVAVHGPALCVVHRLLIAEASPVEEHRLKGPQASVVVAQGFWSTGSIVSVLRLRCSASCRIFPDQGSNPIPLH